MKRIIVISVVLMLAAAAAFASGGREGSVKLADGVYFAQEDGFNAQTGWKSTVTLTVKDGKIASALWNAAHVNGGPDKMTQSKSGAYGMAAHGNAQSEWHEQAEKVQAWLLTNQDPTAITYKDDEGHTDAISGVSVHVSDFFSLAEKALAKGPVGYGPYKDGAYRAEEPAFNAQTGWKSTVDITVISGYIVSVNWNAVHKDGGEDKKAQSKSGAYGMAAKGGAQAEWHDQAVKVEAHLLSTQDPTAITYKDDEGHTDAISGVSVHVSDFFTLSQKALANAKR